jgi:glycosyltransferase involved in cell wall biosynthesis
VDTIRFNPSRRDEGRAALGVQPDTLVFGTVGRLLPVKDHATFLAALAVLRQRGLPFQAVIVGDGPLRRALADSARALDLSSSVRFVGNRDDVAALLAGLDVFVQSSISEGLSNTVLEAMASGVPVVATDVGGTGELVEPGYTGLLAPASNPAALASAIGTLATDAPARQRMGLAARARAQSTFTLSGMVAAYERLYVELFARATRAAQYTLPVEEQSQ